MHFLHVYFLKEFIIVKLKLSEIHYSPFAIMDENMHILLVQRLSSPAHDLLVKSKTNSFLLLKKFSPQLKMKSEYKIIFTYSLNISYCQTTYSEFMNIYDFNIPVWPISTIKVRKENNTIES